MMSSTGRTITCCSSCTTYYNLADTTLQYRYLKPTKMIFQITATLLLCGVLAIKITTTGVHAFVVGLPPITSHPRSYHHQGYTASRTTCSHSLQQSSGTATTTTTAEYDYRENFIVCNMYYYFINVLSDEDFVNVINAAIFCSSNEANNNDAHNINTYFYDFTEVINDAVIKSSSVTTEKDVLMSSTSTYTTPTHHNSKAMFMSHQQKRLNKENKKHHEEWPSQTRKWSSSASSRTLYEILGAKPTDTRAELKSRYIALARLSHPDALRLRSNSNIENNNAYCDTHDNISKSNDPDFVEIAAAWRVLSDNKLRRKYDRTLRAKEISTLIAMWADDVFIKVITAIFAKKRPITASVQQPRPAH